MISLAIVIFTLWALADAACVGPPPTATVQNGTYVGVHSPSYNQDFFLGMPYAKKPLGDLRFTTPQSLKSGWKGLRDAKAYSDICVGYGVSCSHGPGPGGTRLLTR